jgi:hypothetical protein
MDEEKNGEIPAYFVEVDGEQIEAKITYRSLKELQPHLDKKGIKKTPTEFCIWMSSEMKEISKDPDLILWFIWFSVKHEINDWETIFEEAEKQQWSLLKIMQMVVDIVKASYIFADMAQAAEAEKKKAQQEAIGVLKEITEKHMKSGSSLPNSGN